MEEQIKTLFDLVENKGEGIYAHLHIIDNSDSYGDRISYRIYHSDGYCFDISREELDLGEDEMCNECIDEFYYSFMDDLYEGFKDLTVEEAITLIKTN